MNLARAGHSRMALYGVGDVEVDELGAVVVALSEGDREADLPYRGGGVIGYS